MGKTGKNIVGILALVFGVLILFKHDLLAVLVAIYLIVVGVSNLLS